MPQMSPSLWLLSTSFVLFMFFSFSFMNYFSCSPTISTFQQFPSLFLSESWLTYILLS
uniref:ATP synthase F0 subunit 8 n=1 Tax=Hoplopleura sp. TaxID=2782173 RepID=A0A7S8WWA3_9NEOP|nr:ATP synthase F0 subunit 8 [Hoplopleura sp.]